MDIYELARKINKDVNASTEYHTDMELYNQPEFWAIARENIDPSTGLMRGDCEDYALEKRQRLLEAGVPVDKLRLAVCTVETGEGHAVLVVETEQGDVVLDNRQSDLETKSDLEKHGYVFLEIQKPGENEWLYVPPPTK